ncbi:MAG: NAD-dependent epimerase/dehydratase family protein [Pirellulales bacterium]
MNSILVTGAAGFIGYHLAQRLLNEGYTVVGVDSLSPYYSVELKDSRRARLSAHPRFRFIQLDLADRTATADLFAGGPWDAVLHFAAQPGVRYSQENPAAYIDSNLVVLGNVLEGCREARIGHLVLASSSSVYGTSSSVPFAATDRADQPVSLYAATKRAGELLAHAYSHQYGLPTTVLRLFTVYGPWGRPDMALWKFADAILAGRSIDVYNAGQVRRDFTYIDDVVEGVMRVLLRPPQPNELRPSDAGLPPQTDAPLRVYNLGSHCPEPVSRLIDLLEELLAWPAVRRHVPLPRCELPETFADIESFVADFGYRPDTTLEVGVRNFVKWWRDSRQALVTSIQT